MANILYGVNGEGAGHSTRAKEVLAHLVTKGHSVHVASFDRGGQNLKAQFDVTEIYGFRFAYVNNRVRYQRTIAKNLIARCDVFIENFKVGDMKKYRLDYAELKFEFPRLIYCSITGFGQTGPYAPRAGYDFLAQGMGGIMSITGQPDGEPTKVGVAVTDIVTGIFTSTAILAAIHHRTVTHVGQYIDMSLLDSQVGWLANAGMQYLVSGQAPQRLGVRPLFHLN